MIRQLLTESLLLALIGGAVGVLFANLGIELLVALSPPELPRRSAIRLDRMRLRVRARHHDADRRPGRADAGAAGLERSTCSAACNRASHRAGRGGQRTRRALVVAEVALALMLLVSAGLLLRSLQRLFAVDPGFDPAHVLTMQVQTSGRRFADDGVSTTVLRRGARRGARVPGVDTAALHQPVAAQRRLRPLRRAVRVALERSPRGGPAARSATRLRPGTSRRWGSRCVAAACSTSTTSPERRWPSSSASRSRRAGSRAAIRSASASTSESRPAVVHRRRRRRRREADVAGSESTGRGVRHDATQWPSASRALWLTVRARGDAATLRSRRQERNLVGRQGPADRPRRDDGRSGRRLRGGAAVRADPVRGVRPRRARPRRDRHLRRALGQRDASGRARSACAPRLARRAATSSVSSCVRAWR